MYNSIIKKEQGFVVLLLIVTVASVIFLVAYNAILLSLRELELGYTLNKSYQVSALAEGCLEESLRQLILDLSYSGGTINTTNGVCTVVVQDLVSDKQITVTTVVDSFTQEYEALVNMETAPYVINSWEKVL